MNLCTQQNEDPIHLHVLSEDGIEKQGGIFADITPLKEALVIDTTLTQLDNNPKRQTATSVSRIRCYRKVRPVDIIYLKKMPLFQDLNHLFVGLVSQDHQ